MAADLVYSAVQSGFKQKKKAVTSKLIKVEEEITALKKVMHVVTTAASFMAV